MALLKNKILLISIVIVFVSLLIMLARIGPLIGAGSNETVPELTFIQVTTGAPEFSLSPLYADLEHNDRLMSLVVGSLLRMDRDGNIVPYLAQSYSVSKDGKIWTFVMRDGLFAGDESPITAEAYVESFNRLARLYVKNLGRIPYFDALQGFEAFRSNLTTISGIEAVGNKVVFKFSHAPENYLIIYAVPAFGYYTSSDFKNGEWADPEKLNSTGPMRVESFAPTSVKLIARKNWPLNVKEQIKEIDLKLTKDLPAPRSRHSVVRVGSDFTGELPGFRRVPGIPQWLVALILNPSSAAIPPKTRQAMAYIWWIWQQTHKVSTDVSKSSPNFNFLDQYNFSPPPFSDWPPKINQHLTIGIGFSLSSEEQDFIQGLFREFQSKLGVKLVLRNLEHPNFEDFFQDKLTNGRINRVVVGANAHNSNNQIIFSTKLGVCFPDPSGKIQELIKSYSDQGKSIDSEYLNRFAQYLYQDASVFPLFHRSNIYLVSEDIPSTLVPSDIDDAPLDRFSP